MFAVSNLLKRGKEADRDNVITSSSRGTEPDHEIKLETVELASTGSHVLSHVPALPVPERTVSPPKPLRIVTLPLPNAQALPSPLTPSPSERNRMKLEIRKAKQEAGASKPPNAFILFRRDFAVQLHKVPFELQSKMIGQMWQQAPPEVKNSYLQRAQILRESHKTVHGDTYKVLQAKKREEKRQIQEAVALITGTQAHDWRSVLA